MAYEQTDKVKEARHIVKIRTSNGRTYTDKIGKLLIYQSGKIKVQFPFPSLWADVITDAQYKQMIGANQTTTFSQPPEQPAQPQTPYDDGIPI